MQTEMLPRKGAGFEWFQPVSFNLRKSEQKLALALSTHHRLGAESKLSWLDPYLLRYIAENALGQQEKVISEFPCYRSVTSLGRDGAETFSSAEQHGFATDNRLIVTLHTKGVFLHRKSELALLSCGTQRDQLSPQLEFIPLPCTSFAVLVYVQAKDMLMIESDCGVKRVVLNLCDPLKRRTISLEDWTGAIPWRSLCINETEYSPRVSCCYNSFPTREGKLVELVVDRDEGTLAPVTTSLHVDEMSCDIRFLDGVLRYEIDIIYSGVGRRFLVVTCEWPDTTVKNLTVCKPDPADSTRFVQCSDMHRLQDTDQNPHEKFEVIPLVCAGYPDRFRLIVNSNNRKLKNAEYIECLDVHMAPLDSHEMDQISGLPITLSSEALHMRVCGNLDAFNMNFDFSFNTTKLRVEDNELHVSVQPPKALRA